jgi:hypothetical protein
VERQIARHYYWRGNHHWRRNLAEYRYLEKRYGRKGRRQVFWTMTTLVVLLIGSLVVISMSETDVQRKARIQAEQAYIVRVACKLGQRACAVAQEDARKVACKLYPGDCPLKDRD